MSIRRNDWGDEEIRKELRRRPVDGQLRYLTCSCRHRLPLFGNDRIKQVFVERLYHERERHGFELWAWVVMANHVHLLLRPARGADVPGILWCLKRSIASEVVGRWRELDAPVLRRITDKNGRARFWDPGGGYDHNVISAERRRQKVLYIHENPVRKGICTEPTDYPWSSARSYAGWEGAWAIDGRV